MALIRGTTGADTLLGAGGDTLEGGAGNDLYILGGPGDLVVERSSAGVDSIRAAFSFTLPTHVENLILIGDIDGTRAVGSGFDNSIYGDAGANRLLGLAGADRLYGGAGDDTLDGGTNDDLLNGGAGVDTAFYGFAPQGVWVDLELGLAADGAWGEDRLSGMENVVGSVHADLLRGSPTRNLLEGGAGSDLLDGRGGRDTLRGGAGDDQYYVAVLSGKLEDTLVEAADEGVDTLVVLGPVAEPFTYLLAPNFENLRLYDWGMGAPDDVLWEMHASGNALGNAIEGNGAANRLSGGAGDDELAGYGGADTLDGGTGDDVLYGVDGDDDLCGGKGNDVLDGGAGADRFFFDTALNRRSNVDTIVQFELGLDSIVLSAGVFARVAELGVASALDQGFLVYQGESGLLSYDPDGVAGSAIAVQFARVDSNLDHPARLAAEDFQLAA